MSWKSWGVWQWHKKNLKGALNLSPPARNRVKLAQGCAGKWGTRSAECVRNMDILKMGRGPAHKGARSEGDDPPPRNEILAAPLLEGVSWWSQDNIWQFVPVIDNLLWENLTSCFESNPLIDHFQVMSSYLGVFTPSKALGPSLSSLSEPYMLW